MPDLLLLGLGCLDGLDVQSILVLATLEHTVGEGVESLFLVVELPEGEPEPDPTLDQPYVSRRKLFVDDVRCVYMCAYK